MMLFQDGLLAFFSAVGVTTVVWLVAGAKIVLADCGLSDDAKALAACLADRGKDVVLVDGAKFHVE